MYDPIQMNPESQPQQDPNAEVLAKLAKIERNTAATKGWLTFFGILVIITLVVYLVITFLGMATILNLFSGIMG